MNQELILAVAAALAGLLLLAGLVQALSPPPRRRRRKVRRRPLGAPPRRRLGESGAAAAEALPPSRRTAPAFTPRARPEIAEARSSSAPPASGAPAVTTAPSPLPPVATPLAPPRVAPALPPVSEPAPSARAAAPRVPGVELPLEECFRLYDHKQYQEVVAAAEPALQLGEAATTAPRAQDVARLWSVLALSRQALGDEEGALSAFEEAIHTAPEDDRTSYQAQMVALAVSVSRRLAGQAEQAAEGAGEEQVRRLKQAMVWLRQGLAAVPGHAELASALERVRQGLWASYNQAAAALIQRQEFHRARRLVREALSDDEFPAERQSHFRELLSATFSGEIGQLTASAIRTLEDEREREAQSFLQRAEGILSAMPADAITPKRREDANRRLWWGYTKLGMRRVEAGEYEEALEPLFHALGIRDIDPERQQETREALVRALEGVTDARGATIAQLAKDGNRSAAAAEGERLKALMRQGLERGLSQQELSLALTKARRLLEALERSATPEA